MCGLILQNQMVKYNDLNYLVCYNRSSHIFATNHWLINISQETLHSPYVPWGCLIVQSNLQQNQLLLKNQSILADDGVHADMMDEADLFSTLWYYHILKGQMMKTVLWGFAGEKG